jgi:Tfp pilus assembly protein PilP
MKKMLSLLTLTLSLVIVGCGDSPENILRDWIAHRNEVADSALRVTDEASAKATREGQFKAMKERFDRLKKRLDDLREKKKMLEDFEKVQESFRDEMAATGAYLDRAEKWIENVKARSQGQETLNLNSFVGDMNGLSKIDLPKSIQQGTPSGAQYPGQGGGGSAPGK